MIRCIRSLLLSAVLLAAVPSFAAEPSPAAWIPGDYDAYLELRDLRANRKRFLASNFWAKLQKTRLYTEAAAEPGFAYVRQLQDHWKAAFGRTFEETFDDVLGSQSALAMRFPGTGEPEGLIVGKGASEAALKDLLERFIGVQVAEGKGRPQETAYAGGRIFKFGNEHFIGLLKDHWAAAEKEEAVKSALDRMAGTATDTLEARAAFREAFADLPAGALGRFYLDVKQLSAKQPPPADPAGQRVMRMIGTVRSLAIALYPGDGFIKAEFALRADAGGFHPVLSTLLGPEPASSGAVKICPPDVFFAAGVSLDTAAFRKALEEAVPELTRDDGYLIFVEAFYKPYIERLGPEFALVARRGEPAAGGAGPRIPSAALAAKVRDPDVARTIIAQARSFAAVARLKSRRDGIDIALDEGPHRDVPLLSVNLDAAMAKRKETAHLAGAIRPTVAQVGEYLVVGLNDSLVRSMIDAHAGGPNLAADPTFRRAFEGLPEKNSGWTFVSFGRLADVLADNRSLLAVPGPEGAGPVEAGRRFEAALELLRLFDTAGATRTSFRDRARQTLLLRVAE
jgi:hypothetical protein